MLNLKKLVMVTKCSHINIRVPRIKASCVHLIAIRETVTLRNREQEKSELALYKYSKQRRNSIITYVRIINQRIRIMHIHLLCIGKTIPINVLICIADSI